MPVDAKMASSPGGDECYICSLPPEMMESVAVYLPAADLASLRATCRDLNNKVLRAFGQEAFSDMTFLLAVPSSMQVLEDISNHPTFAKCIDNLTFTLQRIKSAKWDNRELRMQHEERSGRRTFDRAERIKHRELMIAHQRVRDEAKSFGKVGWQKALLFSLTNLKRCRNDNVAIGITLSKDLPSTATQPRGNKEIQRIFGHDQFWEDSSVLSPDTTPDLLRTILSSDCAPRLIHVPDRRTGIRTWELNRISRLFGPSKLLTQLVSLNLCLDPHYRVFDHNIDGLKNLLSASPLLSHLRLVMGHIYGSYPNVFEDLTSSLFLERLETVKFGLPCRRQMW